MVQTVQDRQCDNLRQRVAEQTRVLAEAAEELRAEIRRREQAQAALLQAQKLEALAHLTGGIAHDFKNILQAVAAAFELLALNKDEGKQEWLIEQGRKAVEQADVLTRRLLRFARRDEREFELVWLPEHLDGTSGLIRQVLRYNIRCRIDCDQGVWPILVDRHELDTVLLNLAVNARDAMSGSGEVRLGARNSPLGEAKPPGVGDGDHVELFVSDSGCGMPPEVLARATETFFTTKGPEHGTGLGLSMARGFAVGLGGELHIDSTVGRGTTVRIFLPRAAEAVEPPCLPAGASAHHGGTVLLADEQEASRTRCANGLRELGYNVIEAGSAQVALALSYGMPVVDLAIASLTLPGGGADELARRLRIERPGLAVLRVANRAEDGELVRPLQPEAVGLAVTTALSGRTELTEREGVLSERLMARLGAAELKDFLAGWRRLRGACPLPLIWDAEQMIAPYRERVFIASVDASAGRPKFRLDFVGEGLAALRGEPLEGRSCDGPEDEAAFGSLAGTYARATRTLLPVYDWLRHSLGDGPPVRFDRLVLPVSEDGETVSHLVGMVLISDLACGGHEENT